jgi:hypothetical protein
MENVLWLVSRVDISLDEGLDELFVVVDGGIDDTVTDGLCHDLLSFLNAFKAQLGGDVS